MLIPFRIFLALALVSAVYVFLVEPRQAMVWYEALLRFLLLTSIGFLAVMAVFHWSIRRPVTKTARWVRRLLEGKEAKERDLPRGPLLGGLTQEIQTLAKGLKEARAAAGEEARLRIAGESRWTPERLREHVRTVLQNRPLIVVANREPYMHIRQGRDIKWVMPASGLVTAVEPILRACGGTWIASGSGDADRETADSEGRLRVPPDVPLYTLRRIFLEKAEEEGYYYGFSNEGLWPLCHIAYTQPVFRADDWEQYRKVNVKFANATLDELSGTKDPFVLVQDYHYALLPRLIKDKRPDARVVLFWHIPWPNPEAFDICPWAREILHGMLGADLLGFHIQFHCNNFLDTVGRMLEARIDREHFSVSRAGHRTWVKPFAIGIDTGIPLEKKDDGVSSGPQVREQVLDAYGLKVQWLGVGVDRIDYTKGLVERLRGIERFLEKYPEYREKFTFVEVGSPSRTGIKRYSDLGEELVELTERINGRFQSRGWTPILFLKEHHSQEEIGRFYRAADVCLVTSLHDGMNLVAKEFVASRDDGKGVLILSRFAGASRQLRDAILVNPYDLDEMADAIREALTMGPQEQSSRMASMREILQESNVYHWAADLVTELGRIRPMEQRDSSSHVLA